MQPRLLEAGPPDAGRGGRLSARQPRLDDWAVLVGATGAIGLRAVALDLPDFGETIAAPGFEHSAPGYATFLAKALERLGVERAHLVLHDFGAYLPAAFAARQRDAFPSAEVHVLPASGHWPFADAAEAVERLLVGFLSRVAVATVQDSAPGGST